MKDVIHWAAIERLIDINLAKLEARIVAQMFDIVLPSGQPNN
jgi:hypothetical protein